MEKITKEERRNRCLPSLGSIYRNKRKSKKEAAAAKPKVVPELIIVKKEDKSYEELKKNGKCWMSEDVEGGKSPVEYGYSISNKNGTFLGNEADVKLEDIAEILKDKEEDSESKMVVVVVVEDNKSLLDESNAANKNCSFREKKVITGEGSKDMTGKNRDKVLAVDESLMMVESKKDEKSDKKSTAEHGLESVRVNRTEAEKAPTKDDFILRKRVSLPPREPALPPSTYVLHDPMEFCGPTSRKRNEFHKVKTFDLKGVIKSSGKGLKSIAWPRRFSVK